MLKKIALVSLSLFCLNACAVKHSNPYPESSDHQQAKVLITDFVEGLLATNKRNFDVYTTPFWVDSHWTETMDDLKKEIPSSGSGDMVGIHDLKLRLYPINHLDVLNHRAWKRLKDNPKTLPARLDNLYIAAVTLKMKGSDKVEHGWVLMRKIDGNWKVAGIIEE